MKTPEQTKTASTPTPPAALPPETAERILQTDIANVLLKCKSGRPLTRYERRLIEAQRHPRDAAEHPLFYDSMHRAAVGLKLSLAVVRRAKRMGAPGFQSGRVYPAELLPWLRKHGNEAGIGDYDSARLAVMMEQARRLKLRNDQTEGALVRRSEVASAVVASITAAKGILRYKLEQEYPAKVAGLDIPQARIYGKRLVDEVCAEMQKLDVYWK